MFSLHCTGISLDLHLYVHGFVYHFYRLAYVSAWICICVSMDLYMQVYGLVDETEGETARPQSRSRLIQLGFRLRIRGG